MTWAISVVGNLDCNRQPTITPEVSDYLRASLADSTRRAYRSDLNHFLTWGGSIPCSPEIVAQYLAAHAEQQATATLARRLVSIGKAHTSQNRPSPTKSDLVKAIMKGIRRTFGSAQRQVAPAIKEDVLAMVNGLTGIKGIRDRAMLLIGFAGAFRRSELVSLTVEDVEHVKQGLVILLRRSKTDQAGEGRKISETLPSSPTTRREVCCSAAIRPPVGHRPARQARWYTRIPETL